MVAATFPNVPDFTCDSWCYESAVDFLDARALGGTGLNCVTATRTSHTPSLSPESHPNRAPSSSSRGSKMEKGRPPDYRRTRHRSTSAGNCGERPAFASKPDPYPEFIKRCFIFTETGVVFLDKTTRRPIPVHRPTDPYNNRPGYRCMSAMGRTCRRRTRRAGRTTVRAATLATVIGGVPPTAGIWRHWPTIPPTTMCQAWHDCMHNNPLWLPAKSPPDKQVWRLKLYVMENNPDALMARVVKDFPNANPRRGE